MDNIIHGGWWMEVEKKFPTKIHGKCRIFIVHKRNIYSSNEKYSDCLRHASYARLVTHK